LKVGLQTLLIYLFPT